MYFVYFLRSESSPEQTYTGSTANLEQRLRQHNEGIFERAHTRKFRPWKIETFILADTRENAEIAEAYFKNSSGKEKFADFAEENPDHPNPIEGFFDSQESGRLFGRAATGFRVKNKIVTVTRS